MVLVAGYVVLAVFGKDVQTYLLFLGGPAVTTIVGAVLSRRVTGVAAAVVTAAAPLRSLVTESVSDLDEHLTQQDQTLGEIAAGVNGDPDPPAPPPTDLPTPRTSPSMSRVQSDHQE